MDAKAELDVLERVARSHGVDPLFLLTIRCVEGGRPGREMGVLSVNAPEFADQVAVAAKTLRNRLTAFPGNPLTMAQTQGVGALRRLRYTDAFICDFAAKWAPPGALNDPDGLNFHWTKNAMSVYARLVAESGAEPDPTMQA